MLYRSTRGDKKGISSAEAIVRGLSGDGGLYVPESFPSLSVDEIVRLTRVPYSKRAAFIMSLFMDDFSLEELEEYSSFAYGAKAGQGFDDGNAAPLHKINNNTRILELWHGPTCAFKDMALQVMPKLLTASLKKTGETREVCILVATSGDTGKAALEGFCDVQGTKIMVFYPRDGVSQVQKLQMISQRGSNVNVVAVEGNFDDAQTGVKEIFADEALRAELDATGVFLSSANSINWGRLVPQIAYYVSAYCDLLKNGDIMTGDRINFCVPTGNFGNILAAYYAGRMGLPINKLICASNRNDVLTQFINSGVYDKNRAFYATASPSMDILVSSNLERLLFELSGKDGSAVKSFMSALAVDGCYAISDSIRRELNNVFASGRCSEEDTLKTIKSAFAEYDYLFDTHTAVAYKVLRDYRKETGDDSISVVVSTASPFKFCEAVLEALCKPAGDCVSDIDNVGCVSNSGEFSGNVRGNVSGVGLIEVLSEKTGCKIPKPLTNLKGRGSRFNVSVAVSGMKEAVCDFVRGR